ncbi:regulatory protein RecX [Patescibacteria group bacterium]
MSDDLAPAQAYAMKLLGFRSHSIAEMQQKMARKKFSHESIKEVIAGLRNQGYLNDHRFTQELIRSLIRRKPVGRFYLMAKLKDHGIPEEIARVGLANEFPLEKEKELAKQAAERKMEEFEVKLSRISYNQRAKLSRFLNSRGFSSEIIGDTLDILKG